MPASPFDHPLMSELIGDEEISAQFAVEAELSAMIEFESALARAQAHFGVIPAPAAQAILEALSAFVPDRIALAHGMGKDAVVVPELVRQLRHAVGEEHGRFVHFGATSQDAVDTGLATRLVRVLDILANRLEALGEALGHLEREQGRTPVMAHTRMQAAMTVPAGRKIRSWREPLQRHVRRLAWVSEDVGVLHLGGAAGTLDALGRHAGDVRALVARQLKLRVVDHARHSERDGFAQLAGWLALVSGSLGKMGQDVALMAQSELGEVSLADAGGSSAMPHKRNPVKAEVLVSLARLNAVLVSGMHQAMVHENERSGAAWTLEWLILPQMAMATGAGLRIAGEIAPALTIIASDRR